MSLWRKLHEKEPNGRPCMAHVTKQNLRSTGTKSSKWSFLDMDEDMFNEKRICTKNAPLHLNIFKYIKSLVPMFV